VTKGVQHTTFYRIADKPQIKNIQHANAKAPLINDWSFYAVQQHLALSGFTTVVNIHY